jgi:hypothetical protein
MISLLHSFSDHINIIIENLLKTWCHAVSNEKIKNIHTDVKKEERQCTMLQIRMKVTEHESSFITFAEFQFIINNMKTLQKQQNYLKMYIQHEVLSVKNTILLKNLKQASSTSNFEYFSMWWSCAFNCFDLKFCKKIIIRIMKSSFNDDSFKKRAVILKIIFSEKFSDEKKYEFIIDENLKLFFQKLKLNFVKMNYVKNNNKLDYTTEYVKVMITHYLQQMKKTIEKKDCRITWAEFLKTLQKYLLDAKLLQNQVNNMWNIIIKRSDQTCVSFFLEFNKTHFQNHVKVMKFKKVLLFRFLSELISFNKVKLIVLTFTQRSKMSCQELMKYINI